MDKIYLLIGNDTPLAVCLRKSEGEETPVPYDLSEARHLRLTLVGHGMRVCAKDIEVSGDDNNVVSGMIPGRSLLPGDYDLELTFVLDGRDKRFAVEDMFVAVTYLSEDQDGTAEGEGDGISITVTVQPEVIEIAGPTGPRGKSAYEVWLDEGHTGTEDDFFRWLAAQTPNPDWAQNDASEPDYVENRTHYDIPAVSLPDAFITFRWTEEDYSDLMFYLNDETPMPRMSENTWGVQLGQWLLSCYINGNVLEVDLDGDPILTVANFRPGRTPQPIPVGDIEVPELVQQLDGKYLALKTVNGQSVKGSGGITLDGSNIDYTGADGDAVIIHGDSLDDNLKALDDKAYYLDINKQGKINDLDTIRAGAALGATAYQKPSTGIPKSALASAVKTSLEKADTALQPSDLNGYATEGYVDQEVYEQVSGKQDTLISGENIKTINGFSILGGGNLYFPGPVQSDWNEDDDGDDAYIKNKPTDMVKYTEQELTEAQKAQARTNIAAASESEVSQLRTDVDGLFGSADADLDIEDENGIVLARFENGNFRVKNFNSALTPQQEDVSTDFAITDENENAIAIFHDGHIKTKNFNSKTFFYGKKVSIIGDSISTAINHNAVEFTVLESDISAGRTLQGYPTYYDIGTTIGGITVTSSMVGVLTSFTPVSGDAGKTIGKALNYNSAGNSGVASYTDTWWHKLASALGMEVLQNVSWSGASISSHEGNSDQYKTSYAWHPAQINKLAFRDVNGTRITPDVVIIYRGTNDMSHTPYTSLSDFGADAASIPDTDFENSSYDFKVAYCLTIKKIREAYPQAKIVLCTLNVFKRINYSQFPTNNGYNTLPEYNNAIREVADMMGCGLIEFDKDGITFENCYPTYISDSSTIPTHPNPMGHSVMAEKAIIDIKKF